MYLTMTARLTRTRSKKLSRTSELVLGVAGLVTVVAIWALASATGALPTDSVPPPGDVAVAFGQLLIGGAFWLAALQTVAVAVMGIVVVILIAVPVAIAIHRSLFVRDSTWFVIEFLKPIPPVALIPLTILLWGSTKSVELFLVVFAALWPMLTQLVYGLREVSGIALDMAKVYRLTPTERTFRIVLPSLTPFAMTGLRIAITMALVVAIVTEYIVGIPGLGSMLSVTQNNAILDRMWALIVAMGLLGLAFNGLVTLLNRPLLFWHASQRERSAQ